MSELYKEVRGDSRETSTGKYYHGEVRVVSQCEVAPEHFRLRLHAPEIATTAQPGQFVHLLPRSSGVSDPLLRRAFSVLSKHKSGDIEVLYRVMGRGTANLCHLVAGEKVSIIGPLGTGFTRRTGKVLLVGGGVGVPPLAMLASQRKAWEISGIEALLGARTAAELLCQDDFARHKVALEVATDDGSAGHHGFVTDLIRNRLQHGSSGETVVYSCGPLPMLRAVALICQEHAVPCQVSLEENMPCGIGVCNGCGIPIVGQGDDYSRYRRICVEGPAVWADEFDWLSYETGGCSQ